MVDFDIDYKNIKRVKAERKFWDKIASRYDPWIESAFKDQYVEYKSKLSSYIKPNDTILEIGTGTGEIACYIADKCKMAIGVDIAEKMIDIANEKHCNREVNNINFKVGDAYNLPFSSSSFDKVICCNVLQTMKDPSRAISEGKRVLKDNGEFISITYCFGDSGLLEQLMLIKWIVLLGMPIYWTNFTRDGLKTKFNSEGLKIIESSDVWEKPVALFLRCGK